ncbi:MAG: hypothetical protein IJP92_02080 [Lachnospiraceae bacterium]|nr:hypothetical protein [Lachnospiraceae bacterium]
MRRRQRKPDNRCPLVVLLLLTSLFFTVVGIMGRKNLLRAYEYDYADAPLLSLGFRGLADGITPFDILTYKNTGTAPVQVADTASSAPYEGGLSQGDTSLPLEGEVAAPQGLTEEVAPQQQTADTTSPVPSGGGQEAAPPVPVTLPEPAGAAAQDAYYADALFIGDSRTVGLSQYVPALDAQATFYCQTSMTIFNAMSTPCARIDGQNLTIDQALQYRRFGKIYIMLGINEIGSDTNQFIGAYDGVLRRLRELQPDAVIYVQSIMHVSDKKQRSQPLYNNNTVNIRNERLKALCDGARTIWLDTNILLDDENGCLSEEHTFDGAHLIAGSYDLWYQMIKAQTR